MADASGISEDTLAWTSQWNLRQDTLRNANARLVNAHHRHPLAQLWGRGTPDACQHDHINVYGTHSFDLETELRREGRRPLRAPAA